MFDRINLGVDVVDTDVEESFQVGVLYVQVASLGGSFQGIGDMLGVSQGISRLQREVAVREVLRRPRLLPLGTLSLLLQLEVAQDGH